MQPHNIPFLILNNEPAPSHIGKSGKNYVLWFEKQNSYVVLSEPAYLLLNAYLESQNKGAFMNQLEDNFAIPKSEAKVYYQELSSFLKDMNAETPILEPDTSFKAIPTPNISNHYTFGDSHIQINYASNKILHLIHPYLSHALVEDESLAHTVFDIFDVDGLLYLVKNKALIGSYEVNNYHFLQGKFAMELVASIYNNTESDWMATFHASTICNKKEAIMIIGDSGNGKSTLSAVLMAHGFDLLADDFTPMLAENQHVYRFPAAISIKKGAFSLVEELFEDFSAAEPQRSTSKPIMVKYLPPSTSFGTSQKHFECQKIVMVKYDDKAISELRECPSEKTLATFIPDSWISPQAKHSKLFLNWLKKLKFYELTYSDNDFAVSRFKELFGQ